MKRFSIALLLCSFIGQAQVETSTGRAIRLENIESKYVASRNVDVWVPDNYSKATKYAVLYMHDGQMLYDAKTTWNKQSWEVDSTAGTLIRERKTKPFIVVGIWNNGAKRHSEYFPQKPYEKMTSEEKDFVNKELQKTGATTEVFQPTSDLYLKFIVEELKPLIDRNYPTLTNAENTFIAGSSMGGLISMYALCEYPEVFGGAACISTHWPGIFSMENNPIPDAFLKYLETHLPDPKNHKFYFDHGDQTLDALYADSQRRADIIMLKGSYTLNQNFVSKVFEGSDHSEKAWRERLDEPLLFLLKK